jgi:hypothetical protein
MLSQTLAVFQMGEADKTIHHLFMAKLKEYITEKVYLKFRSRYKECIRMILIFYQTVLLLVRQYYYLISLMQHDNQYLRQIKKTEKISFFCFCNVLILLMFKK